ncbi:MAG: asparagine--tRNA ligase [Bdellovibrionota bacterium]|nr:asparagine--tRNA ligase [Deltaproteobacteria bacterium]
MSSPTVRINDIGQFLGKTVTIQGWLYNKRSSGKLQFLQVRDGSNIIQCVVFKGDVSEELFTAADKLTQESSLEVTGVVKEDTRSPLGFEIGVTDIHIIHIPSQEYPISPKEHGVAFLLDHRHLWLRSKRQNAILKIRSTLIKAIRDYFDEQGFICLDAPIFTPNACEGTTNLFETDYFGDKAYLSQSGQLYMEAGAMAFGKCYCFGPTFRAEKSKTRRHLTEFWMIEPEVAFMDLAQDMELAQDFLVYVIKRLLATRTEELEILERDLTILQNTAQGSFHRLTYDQAVQKLHALGSDIKWGDDFGADDETILTQEFDRPIIVHRFPKAFKAFYMKEDPDNNQLSMSMDILAPEGYGEIIGGGERETSLDVLEQKIKEHDLPREEFDWYMDLRKFGSVPHAGFGLGLERLVTWVCGLHHLRETIPFPRMMERLKP